MNKRWVFIVASALVLLMAALFYWFNKPVAPELIKPVSVDEYDIVFGSEDAPVQVFVFFDYFCSHCRKFFTDEYPKIEQEFISTKQLQLVLKPVFFSNQTPIVKAYKSAVCLNRNGKYHDMHQLLLVEPEAVFSDSFNELIEEYVQRNFMYAECMYAGGADQYLDETRISFIANRFKGTPTFVINNKSYTGYLNFSKFQQIIYNEYGK
ncbi:MAG: DsbA family protein [Salinivirgaceae bacterium]